MSRETAIQVNSKKVFAFRKPLLWIKISHFEYWPFWILFLPSIIYGLWLALKSQSLTYFSAANPGIELGGFFGESKIGILNKIDPQYLPATGFFSSPSSDAISVWMKSAQANFPVICKPDKGERGFQVEKISNPEELDAYLKSLKGDLIVQEFIDYEHELGILYYRFPDGSQSGISSIVLKEYLSITGDGVRTAGELIAQSDRARFQAKRLKSMLQFRYDSVIPHGEKVVLERIGNHCRGTMFLNGKHLINAKLVQVFDSIANNMEGFYFGRFDLKVKNIEDLYSGTNIRIMEVNGTTSEPAHIYDPSMSFMNAQKSMLFHTHLVYQIARQNHKRGYHYTPLGQALKIVRNHFKMQQQHAR